MRSLCLSALLEAAASCVAAPGHTAQPFKPSPSASRFLFEHWRRSVLSLTERKLHELSNRFSRKQGVARVGDAEGTSECLDERFVAFVDPPYSGVQYSRFYHVLETINDGEFVNVTGIGRYPPILERPQSDYSIPSRSVKAIDLLLKNLASNGVVSILTFPTGATSNGLSGTLVEDLASEYFFVEKIVISGRFSTLGGNKVNRLSRVPAHEAIMTMRPR